MSFPGWARPAKKRKPTHVQDNMSDARRDEYLHAATAHFDRLFKMDTGSLAWHNESSGFQKWMKANGFKIINIGLVDTRIKNESTTNTV